MSIHLRMAYSSSHLNLESTVCFALALLSFSSLSHLSFSAMDAKKNLFLACIFKYINNMTFKLDASVPLVHCGLSRVKGCNSDTETRANASTNTIQHLSTVKMTVIFLYEVIHWALFSISRYLYIGRPKSKASRERGRHQR